MCQRLNRQYLTVDKQRPENLYRVTLIVIDRLASLTLTNVLPDSITEWGILAVSASANTGREEGFVSVSLTLK